MPRAAAIIIKNGSVALIERHRAGLHYFLFPGGGVNDGETLAEAARREVREEVGLDVTIGPLVAEVVFNGADPTRRQQFYFRAEITGGTFGTELGMEMVGLEPAENGTYSAVWIPLTELATHDVRPQGVVELVAQSTAENWPQEVKVFRDFGE